MKLLVYKMCLNMIKCPDRESYPLGRIPIHGKRAAFHTIYRRETEPDFVWRSGSFSAVLQKAGFAKSSDKHFAPMPCLAQQSFQAQRLVAGTDLSYRGWHWTSFKCTSFGLQWFPAQTFGLDAISQTQGL